MEYNALRDYRMVAQAQNAGRPANVPFSVCRTLAAQPDRHDLDVERQLCRSTQPRLRSECSPG